MDPTLFRVILEMEVQKARRLRYSLAVVCVTAEGPPGTEPLLAERVIPRIRSTDVVVDRGVAGVDLMLVDADTSSLPRIVDRLTLDFGDGPWSAGGASFPKNARSAGELLDKATEALAHSREGGGRRLYTEG